MRDATHHRCLNPSASENWNHEPSESRGRERSENWDRERSERRGHELTPAAFRALVVHHEVRPPRLPGHPEPAALPYYSTSLVVAVGALALLPVVLWTMTTVAPGTELTGGGRSPLVGALLVSAAGMSVVAGPLWLRALRTVSVDAVE